MMLTCPLCDQQEIILWHRATRRPLIGREYWRCKICALIFVPPEFHWDAQAEQQIYQQHENHPDDPGYRRFLTRAAEPVLRLVAPHAKGLDFGCGPGPTLSLMLQEAGLDCANYDLYFASDPRCLMQKYDFITSTEVFEHLREPAAVLKQLVACLKPGGLLVIMTQRPLDQAAFQAWHYLMDPTHITFFSTDCFAWIARHFKLACLEIHTDVIVLRKSLMDDAHLIELEQRFIRRLAERHARLEHQMQRLHQPEHQAEAYQAIAGEIHKLIGAAGGYQKMALHDQAVTVEIALEAQPAQLDQLIAALQALLVLLEQEANTL